MASSQPLARRLIWRWWAAYPAVIVPVIAMTMHWGWWSLVQWIIFLAVSARLTENRNG